MRSKRLMVEEVRNFSIGRRVEGVWLVGGSLKEQI